VGMGIFSMNSTLKHVDVREKMNARRRILLRGVNGKVKERRERRNRGRR